MNSRTDDHGVSVVIVTYQSEQYIGGVLDALLAGPDAPDEVIVVDNASTDATKEIVGAYDVQLVSLNDNVGFTGGCHKGVETANNDTVVFLGHDTVPRPGWLGPLVDAVQDADIGAAMATIEDADNPGTFNTSGGHLTYYGRNDTTVAVCILLLSALRYMATSVVMITDVIRAVMIPTAVLTPAKPAPR